MRRVHLVDVLTCPHCKRSRRLLASITDPDVIARILRHLGLPTEPPLVAPARPPPATALPFRSPTTSTCKASHPGSSMGYGLVTQLN